jgi:hypothetical protein
MNRNQDFEPREEIADDGEPRALNALLLQVREHPALPGTYNVMRGFNRNTMWVAMGLLGTMISAALVLAIQEHHPMAAEVAEGPMQKSGAVLPSDNPVALPEVVGLSGKSAGEISSEPATSVDDRSTPEINHAEVQANGTSPSPAQRHDSVRMIRPKTPNVRNRAIMRPRVVDVKTRLLELWHQSLARTNRSHNWTQFSNLNKEGSKKVSNTAETTQPSERGMGEQGQGSGGADGPQLVAA